jgi:hypothetical protein
VQLDRHFNRLPGWLHDTDVDGAGDHRGAVRARFGHGRAALWFADRRQL